jgi:hypothetical protein
VVGSFIDGGLLESPSANVIKGLLVRTTHHYARPVRELIDQIGGTKYGLETLWAVGKCGPGYWFEILRNLPLDRSHKD